MSETFEPGAWRNEKAPEEIPFGERLRLLRLRIGKAEQRSDDQEVRLLEAEIRATEAGKLFDREEFLREEEKKKQRSKSDVLREMQGLNGSGEKDIWNYDGMYSEHSEAGYDEAFLTLLHKLNYESIARLVHERAGELKRPL